MTNGLWEQEENTVLYRMRWNSIANGTVRPDWICL